MALNRRSLSVLVLVDMQLGFFFVCSWSWVFTGIVSPAAVIEFLCAIGEFGAQGVLQLCILSVTSLSLEWTLS